MTGVNFGVLQDTLAIVFNVVFRILAFPLPSFYLHH